MRLAAAMLWYSRGSVSQEMAAQIAGVNRKEFLAALARKEIDVFQVNFDDLKRELEDDSLVDDLLQCNPEFQTLLAKSQAGPRKPFPPSR